MMNASNPPSLFALGGQNKMLVAPYAAPVSAPLLPVPTLPPFRFDLPTCWHEAAHVIHHVKVHKGIVVARVDGEAGVTEATSFGLDKGGVPFAAYQEIDLRQARLIYRQGLLYAITCLVGIHAEKRHREEDSPLVSTLFGGQSDALAALSIARWLEADDKKARLFVGRVDAFAKNFVNTNWFAICRVAQHLARYGSIEGDHKLLQQLARK